MVDFEVDPTLVSPAATSITREPIASSCRDQTDHTGSVRQRPCSLDHSVARVGDLEKLEQIAAG